MDEGSEKSIPYTQNEKLLLASLVDKYKMIVENKRTDATTVQKKQEGWTLIAKEYNCQAHVISVRRSAAQLKKLWNNLKQRKRKATTEVKYNWLLTGGGPEPKEIIDPVMEAVDVAAPHADVSLPCFWDSTAAYEKNKFANTEQVTTSPQEDVEDENAACEQIIVQVEGAGSSSLYSPGPSKRMKTTAAVQGEANLRVQKVKDSLEQQEQLHQIKIQIEMAQLQVVLETKRKLKAEADLAELQLKVFKEKHNL